MVISLAARCCNRLMAANQHSRDVYMVDLRG